jgi:predicted transcriptional regulator
MSSRVITFAQRVFNIHAHIINSFGIEIEALKVHFFHIRFVVESPDDVTERWSKALRGKVSSSSKEEIISVGSWEILAKIFSGSRLQILSVIVASKPKSNLELAKLINKDFKNVHSDVKFLAGLGLLELKTTKSSRKVMPVAKFSEIELPLVA